MQEGLPALASTQHIVGTHLSNRLRIAHAFTLSAKVQCNNSLRICSSFTSWLRYNVLKSPNWALVVGIAKQIPRNWYGCRLWWFRMLKTGLRSHQHLLFDHNPFYRRKRGMAQPVSDEQRTMPDGQLGSPDGLFTAADHAAISIDEMVAYKAFLMGLPKSCAHIPLSRDRMMMCMETYHGWSISTWEASTIYASISGTEAVVPTEPMLTLVRDVFRTIWGYADDDGTSEPSQAQDLFKACKAVTGALEAAEPRNALVPAWVEKPKLTLSPPLTTALAGVAGLKHYPARQKMLKPYPEFDELPLAAYNNAPHRPADDGAKKQLEQHARDLLRQLATLDLVLRGTAGVDPSLDPASIVEATFANAAALATAIADS